MGNEDKKIPDHIAFILDGNRRFAKKLNLDPKKGHEYGYKKVKSTLQRCRELGIKEVSLYAFSLQNFNRPKSEFDYIMDLFRKAFDALKKESESKKGSSKEARIRFIGDVDKFPDDLVKNIRELEEKTKEYSDFIINFCMGYGGREEILDSAKRLAQDVKDGKVEVEDIDAKLFEKYLWLNSEPDFIVRTSGEVRTSNFLLWQSNYSEWYFPDCFWPEFDDEQFDKAIKEYSSRKRRFGK